MTGVLYLGTKGILGRYYFCAVIPLGRCVYNNGVSTIITTSDGVYVIRLSQNLVTPAHVTLRSSSSHSTSAETKGPRLFGVHVLVALDHL